MSVFRRAAHHDDDIIDLTEPEPVVEDPASKYIWGMPLPCPKCEKPGYLDRIDARGEVMYQHCPSCFCRWETDRADLESFVNAS